MYFLEVLHFFTDKDPWIKRAMVRSTRVEQFQNYLSTSLKANSIYNGYKPEPKACVELVRFQLHNRAHKTAQQSISNYSHTR